MAASYCTAALQHQLGRLALTPVALGMDDHAWAWLSQHAVLHAMHSLSCRYWWLVQPSETAAAVTTATPKPVLQLLPQTSPVSGFVLVERRRTPSPHPSAGGK
jgi:hypothetical protein